jgi:D-alanyl-D-alanine carboxypeptidase
MNYGLGVFSEQICGQVFWGHSGDFPGYVSISLTSADGSRQVAFAVNDDTITTPQVQAAEAGVVKAALCG